MFFIQELVNNNLVKNNHIIILWNVLQVIGFQNSTSQPGLILKSSSKITLGLIIGETRYLTRYQSPLAKCFASRFDCSGLTSAALRNLEVSPVWFLLLLATWRIENSALRLIMGFDNFDICPQVLRLLNDQNQMVSKRCEELNRVLVLTLARSIRITGVLGSKVGVKIGAARWSFF